MKKWGFVGAAAVLAVAIAGRADAACTITKLMDLPVTMEGHVPVVPATINGQAASFEADSGAFYSTISPGSAAQFGLKRQAAPEGLTVVGVGGTATNPTITTVRNFDLGAFHLHDIQFLVAGNEFGHAGLIGQNVFGLFEVEYDLGHGAIRLFRSKGCEKSMIAYWATKDTSYSMLKIQPVTDAAYHTIGDLTLDGATVKATFDTGAETSILSLQAAAKAGVRPNSPGVEDAGYSYGIGNRRVRTWIGRFKSIRIGDNEEVRNIRIRFGDVDADGESSMLLGADFFLSHRVMVDNRNHRLFLTHNGGPVFDLSMEAKSGDKPAGQAIAGGEPTDAGGFSRRGAAYLARRDVPRALADLRQAVKLAPGEAAYHRQLAGALLADDKRDEAMAELDAAIAAKHDDLDALLMRGELRVGKDKAGARADADAFDRAAPLQSHDRLELAGLYTQLHAPDAAVRAYSQWIAAHPHDIAMAEALNGRCWLRGLAGIELDAALDDCNRAVKLSSKAASMVDSRAMIWFRKGDYAKARADYDMALAANPKAASSLFMRGVAEQRAGDKAAAEKDLSAAKKLDDDRAAFFAGWGIKP